ncbi:hypothetical protein ACQ4PT_009726 [Festuca glaucescens]
MGVSSVLDGTQSPDEFNALANALVDDSLRGWAWKPCCKMVEESNDFGDEDIVEHDICVQSYCDNVHGYDFHIVYSFPYTVPMLCFQGLQAVLQNGLSYPFKFFFVVLKA